MTPGLVAQQIWMVQAITGSEKASDAPRMLTAGPRSSAPERLEIYRSGYRARLVECLLDDYPVLAATLGEPAFEALCHGYIDRYPSASPSLNYFGRRMSGWCRESALHGVETARGFLSDLAALEWALVEAIHAPLEPPFDFASLTELPADAWANICFTPSGSVRLVHSAYPVNAYFQAHKDGSAPSLPAPAPACTAVYRRGLSIWRMDLSPGMAAVLTALLEGVPLGEALGRLSSTLSEPAALAEAEESVLVSFREWVGAGFFSSVRRASPRAR